MPRLLTATLFALTLLSPEMLCAQGFDETASVTDWELEESLEIPIEEEHVPIETGPGFRWFTRVMVGGYAVQDKSSYEGIVIGPSGAYEAGPLIWVESYPGRYRYYRQEGDPVALPFRVDEGSRSDLSLYYGSPRFEETRALGSLEFMAQHLWDRNSGVLNNRPAWRTSYLGAGLSLELGEMPVAERTPLLKKEGSENQRWYAGFDSINYFAYGIRLNGGIDEYKFDGVTNVAGRIYTHNEAVHTSIGPQFGVGRVYSKGRFRFDLSGHLMLGYGEANIRQSNGFGDNALPGRINNLRFLDPTYSQYWYDKDYFATRVEWRATSSYHFKRSWSVDAMARMYAIGTWYQAKNQLVYSLPDFGLGQADRSSLLIGDLYLGLSYLR